MFRTCRELGIETVAVVAPDDAGSLHARSADQRVEIASYLHSEEHIRAATASGADAIHPGYGFLAENADFAAAVEAAGLTWVGPPPEALRLGGDKLAAKRIAREARRPRSARRNAGGDRLPAPRQGGRGRRRARDARRPLGGRARGRARGRRARGGRRVRRRHPLLRALPRAARGTSRCSCSPMRTARSSPSASATAPSSGAIRRCSKRRRPPALPRASRALHEAAVAFGRAIGYRSAGTVEFVVDGRRLLLPRAERPHPGRAPGHRGRHGPRPRRRAAPHRRRRTPRRQSRYEALRSRRRGAPVCRGSEELPAPDRTAGAARAPDATFGVRVDAGVEEGDEVGLAYDPMIAKLIAHAPTREEALDALAAALAETRRRGRDHEPAVPALARRPPVVRAGETTTAFLTEHPPLSALPSLRAPAAALDSLAAQPPAPRLRHRRPTSTTSRIARQRPKARAPSRHRCRARSSASRSRRATPSAPASRSSSSRP